MIRRLCVIAAAFGLAACIMIPEQLDFDVVDVPASRESTPMIGQGDAADDPAIWVHPGVPEHSLILGTNKDAGLYVYDLAGTSLQFLDVGRVNNIDLRGTLAVASNDEVNGLSWFRIDAVNGPVVHLGNTPVQRIEPYGVCLGILNDSPVAGVTYKDGTIEFWEAAPDVETGPKAVLVRTVELSSQLEGCVFDEAEGRIFIGEEAVGIWTLKLSDPASEPEILDRVRSGSGLVADVEGLSLWNGEDGSGYLVASAQEADRFVIYDRQPPFTPRGIIHVAASEDGSIDDVTHTDGLDVTSSPLPGYPRGLMVVQDDGNPASGQDQNFKLVGWALIEGALGLEPIAPAD